MGEDLEQVTTSRGLRAWVRPVVPADAAELQRAHDRLSVMSRYQRFMTGTGAMSDALATYFTDVDHVRHEALIAFADATGHEIVGVARFIRASAVDAEAELAITIADAWQGRGLGGALLGLLVERARARDVRRLTVELLASNDAVRALVLGAGGVLEEEPDGTLVRGHIVVDQSPTPG